jgi:hypothetical protein
MQDQVNATPIPINRVPWNKGKVTGAKPPQVAAKPQNRSPDAAHHRQREHPRASCPARFPCADVVRKRLPSSAL